MMPTINRLTGRFFTVLISLSIAVLLPRTVVAGEAIPRPPLASPAGAGAAPGLPALLAAAAGGAGTGPTLCQISDTVYRADGSPAQGTVLLTWQAFTTAAGQSVTPGSLLVTLDVNGGFNASVAPNTGASPAGSYYKAIFKLSDGTTETEYWVVPNTQTTTIGAIRSKLVPANQAAQFLTRDVADSVYVSLASTQTISGVKTFSASPAVPTPVNPTDTANKAYVDANAGSGNLASPPPIGNVAPNTGAFTALAAADSHSGLFPYVDVRAYGAVWDGQRAGPNFSMTAGSKVLTYTGSGTAPFNCATDVGKAISVEAAGAVSCGSPARACNLVATIAGCTSGSKVTLSAPAVSSESSAFIVWGTDNKVPFQTAVDLAASPNTLNHSVYFPHAVGQNPAVAGAFTGCYVTTGTIQLPTELGSGGANKTFTLYGDGYLESAICQLTIGAPVIADTFIHLGHSGNIIKGLGFVAVPDYWDVTGSAIQCNACIFDEIGPDNWFTGWTNALYLNGGGSEVWFHNNTVEEGERAIYGQGTSTSYTSVTTVTENSFGPMLSAGYVLDFTYCNGLIVGHNTFGPDILYGISLNHCKGFNIGNDDWTTAFVDGGSFGNNELTVQNSGPGDIHDENFNSGTWYPVGFAGSNTNINFHDSSVSGPTTYNGVYISGTGNQLELHHLRILQALASGGIYLDGGAIVAGTLISDNYCAPSITTCVDRVGSAVPSGAYVALNSLDAAVNGLAVAGASTFSISPTVPDPTNNTDAANKEYVDTHAVGTPVTSGIQAAINSAHANNGAPVIVPESYAGTDSFTNPSGIRVQDYRENYGIDSMFTRDVKEWGVKANAQMVSCSATAGSPVLAGCQQWGSGSATNFSSSNIGQTVICYQCGASSGRLSGTPVYASGGSGGTDGYQIVTFTNGGCTVAPIGSIQVSGGVPTGSVSYLSGNAGSGCTSAPTQGTVATVTGTVTFSGAALGHLDLVTTISSISSPTQISMAANSTVSASIQMVYGTDDTAAWNAWALALAGNASANALGYGETTFCGLSIISNTVQMFGFGGYLHGCGLGSFNGNYGSKLIWAGHTTSGLPMMNVQNGEEGRIDRIHFYGNTAAPPIGLQLARISGNGNYIGTDNNFDQLWFGPMWDGSPSAYPNMTTAIFAHGPAGNDDFQRLGTINADAVQVGFDSDNGNATYWDWQTFKVDFSGVGAALVGDVHGRNWFFGGNVTDLMLGSPTTSAMTGRAILDHFGSEGSAQMLANGIGDGQGSLKIGKGSWQLTRNTRSDAEVINIVDTAAARELELDNFIFNSDGTYTGRSGYKLSYGSSANCTIALPVRFYNTNINPENIDAQVLASSVCNGLVQSPLSSDNYGLQTNTSDLHVYRVGTNAATALTHYAQDWQGEASVTGVLNVLPSPVPTYYKQVSPVGTTGSTAYNYEVTCVAGGKETTPSASFGTTTGNATLSSANYNAVYWWPLGGCDSYNVYGDEGSGSLGLLTNIVQGTAFSFGGAQWPAIGIYDKGQYAKGAAPPSMDATGKVYANALSVATDLTARDIAGAEYFVSHYASIQAAINAAYNNGAVLGTVIDDRTAPYSGPGFILYDSVTLKLAATTYTITSTVNYNNGHNNVTAGIVLVPGGHLVGAGTSTNHGTILQAGNGLNADLIASSTVGTGTGASVQWWHWGEIGNLRIIGNGANQTSGECLKIENMGETAKVHDIELSACYSNNVEIIGASATQSAISNVTSNLSVGGAGVAFTNLGGVGVLGGISGDCNHTALIAANFGASGTLQINGLKAEAESSICASQVQDPVILSTTTDSTVLASIKLDGGYAFGSTQHDFLKSSGPGSIQYLQNNFYLTGYTNILNDTVRGQVLPNLSTTTKQPVSYLSNGTIFGNQAFWFQPNTFIQGNPNGTPTELFGLTSSGGALVAAPGNGDNANPGTGGIQLSSYNRSIFGQTPEPMARWGWRFLGSGSGYDTTKWDLLPVWAAGDSSDRSIGNASTTCQNGSGSVSCRWPHIYAADVNATTATIGTLNVTTCIGCGPHLVSGTMQGQTAQITGTGSYATLYSATIPAGTASVGTGLKCRAYFRHSTGSGTVTMQWKLGSTSQAYATTFTGGNSGAVADIEIFTPSSTNAEIVNVPYAYFGGTLNGPVTGLAWNENLTNANTIYLQFNVVNTDKLTGDTFYCQTVQ